jgi:hypothetical protein
MGLDQLRAILRRNKQMFGKLGEMFLESGRSYNPQYTVDWALPGTAHRCTKTFPSSIKRKEKNNRQKSSIIFILPTNHPP